MICIVLFCPFLLLPIIDQTEFSKIQNVHIYTKGVTTLGGMFEYSAVPPALIAAIRYLTESPGESVVSEHDVVVASPNLVSSVSIPPPLRLRCIK